MILGREGADKLLGRSNMLIMDASGADPVHIQGAMFSEKEIVKVINYVSAQVIKFH